MTDRPGITDLHIHVQPWHQMKPGVVEAMRKGKEDHWERLLQLMEDPSVLLGIMDDSDIWRVGLVNYPSPDVMGFTDETNAFASGIRELRPRAGSFRTAARTPPLHDRPRGPGRGPATTRYPDTEDPPAPSGVSRPTRTRWEWKRLAGSIGAARSAAFRSRFTRERASSRARGASSGDRWRSTTSRSISPISRSSWRTVGAHSGWTRRSSSCDATANVYLELSGIPPLKLLDYFPRLAEIGERVVWGTDWPSPGVHDLRRNLDQFLSLPLDDDLKAKITRSTPLSLIPSR